LFTVRATEGGSEIRPTDANRLRGTIMFPLPSQPKGASQFTAVGVAFTSNTAIVNEVAIMSSNDELYRKSGLQKTGDFTLKLSGATGVEIKAEQPENGLALAVAVDFDTVAGKITFRSVGVEVALARPKPAPTVKFDSGTWSTMEVRPWTNTTKPDTQAWIKFSKTFTSAPAVMVSMAGADVGKGDSFRVKVYATDITARGFMVHADTWEDTKLYSCGVSWIAIGF
jgi:H-type lectin domain